MNEHESSGVGDSLPAARIRAAGILEERSKIRKNLVEFRFWINQDVLIVPMDITGRVLARCDRGNFHEYRVVYWAESKRSDDWLCEFELSEKKENGK